MKKINAMAMVAFLFALSACAEPGQPVASDASEDKGPVGPTKSPSMPAQSISLIKPLPADGTYPPGPITLKAVNEYCNVESVNGSVYQDVTPKTVARNQPVKVVGWIVDRAFGRLAQDVGVVIERTDLSKRWEVSGMPAIPRQDVADYYKDFPPELLNSGFSLVLDLSEFEPGMYHILSRAVLTKDELFAITRDRSYCSSKPRLPRMPLFVQEPGLAIPRRHSI